MASEIRNRFTDTEMQIARETDLPELLPADILIKSSTEIISYIIFTI